MTLMSSPPSDGHTAQARAAAIAAARAGDWAGAARFWRDALQQAGEAAPADWLAALATAELQLGDAEAAAASCARARRLHPSHHAGWTLGAQAAAALRDWPAAVALWHEAFAAFDPSATPSWYARLANAARRMGAYEQAKQSCAAGHRRFPDAAPIWGELAYLATARGFPLAAAKAWVQRLHQGGGQAAYLPGAVRALLRAGRFAEADALIGGALTQAPVEARTLRLESLVARGDFVTAQCELAAAEDASALARAISPNVLARMAFEAGLLLQEGTAWLQSLGVEAGALEAAILPQYGLLPIRSMEGAAASARNLPRARPAKMAQRKLLRGFLANRTFLAFEIFARDAWALATPSQRVALCRIAERRFPRSRLPALMRLAIAPRALPADEAGRIEPWRHVLPARPSRVAELLRGLPRRRLVCATVVRDEAPMMRHFLDHYRSLGVTDFVVIDNRSQDDLPAVLAEFPDLRIVHARVEGHFASHRHGMAWVNEVAESGVADWLLFVDADELLVFPGCETTPLPRLLEHLDTRGETLLRAAMIDLYDDAYREGGRPSEAFAAHRWFFADVWFLDVLHAPYVHVSGGIRDSLTQRLQLEKSPLIKASHGVRYRSNHQATPALPAATTAALLHAKVFRDRELHDLPTEEITAHRRVQERSGWCPVRHLVTARPPPQATLDAPFHHRYRDSRQLLALGYVEADPAWRAEHGFPRAPQDRATHAAAEAARQRAAHHVMCLQPTQHPPLYDQILDDAVELARKGERTALRWLLLRHVPRIAPPAARLALLTAVSASMGRSDLLRRLAKRLAEALPDPAADAAVDQALDRVFAASPAAAMAVCDALGAHPLRSRRLVVKRALLMMEAGRYPAVLQGLARTELRRSDRSLYAVQLSLARLGHWDPFHRLLWGELADPACPIDRPLLHMVNRSPEPGIRLALLDAMRRRLEGRWETLTGAAATVWLALLRCLGAHDAVATGLATLRPSLPRAAATFFTRAVERRAGHDTARQPTAWCLGLSKTGTTSLDAYCQGQGLLAGHYLNDILGLLLDEEDLELFDIVSDTPVVHLAMTRGIQKARPLIVTQRPYETWAPSFLGHFSRIFGEKLMTFEDLKRCFHRREAHSYGERWREIHETLYFRHRCLRDAFEAHASWIADAGRSLATPIVTLRLDAPDKAEVVSAFLGPGTPVQPYPHTNRRKPEADLPPAP